jgi:glutamate racemase
MVKIDSYKVHSGYVDPAHKDSTSIFKSPQQKKTTEQMKNVENLLKSYPERQIGKFFNPGGLEQGVHALAAANHVMLSTGFNVEEGMPETDGPPGLAALANALIQTGKTVTFVTDSTNKPLVKACLDILNPNAAKFCRFETFDIKPEEVETAEGKAAQFLNLRETEIRAEKKAGQLLDTYNPDLVLTLELAGRGKTGVAKNMRGKAITGFNAMVDELLNQANKKKITTVAVGDGGNEAGMGGLKGVPKAMDGTQMQARTKAGIPVTSWNSNLGGEALAAGVLAKFDMLDKLHTPEQQTAMIQAVVDNGGVDGVTRGKILGEMSKDSAGRPVATGVDGFDPEVHRGTLRMLENISSTVPTDNGLIAKAAVKKAPFQIAAFDSGAGGLVAARNLAEFIKYRSNHNARFVCISDFGEAPYGAKTRPELIHLVGTGLKTAETVGVDVIAMACNTACTSFKSGPEDKEGLDIDKEFKVPVIDLISITAKAIARHGGDKPVVLSTEATARDDMYENRIKAAALAEGQADGKKESEINIPEVVRIGAGDSTDPNEAGKDWATLINAVKHLSKNEEDRNEFKETIKKYVANIPADASSVWLCCTHYPAIKDEIEQALKDRGLGHIEVIDPMEYQAEAIIKMFDELEASEKSKSNGKAKDSKGKGVRKNSTDRSNRTDDTKPLVITSGKLSEATNATKHLLQSQIGARILSAKLTGTKFSMDLIEPYLYNYELKSPSKNTFDSTHKLWGIPGPLDEETEPHLLVPSSNASDESSNGAEFSITPERRVSQLIFDPDGLKLEREAEKEKLKNAFLQELGEKEQEYLERRDKLLQEMEKTKKDLISNEAKPQSTQVEEFAANLTSTVVKPTFTKPEELAENLTSTLLKPTLTKPEELAENLTSTLLKPTLTKPEEILPEPSSLTLQPTDPKEITEHLTSTIMPPKFTKVDELKADLSNTSKQ